MAYWIAITFIEGSILFVIGAAGSLFHGLEEWREQSLVTASYFSGSIMFLIGAYLGFFEVINVGQPGSSVRFWALSGSSRDGYLGSLSYFIGAIFFTVNTACFLFGPSPGSVAYQWLLPWASATIASAFFTVAAIIEIRHNWEVWASRAAFPVTLRAAAHDRVMRRARRRCHRASSGSASST